MRFHHHLARKANFNDYSRLFSSPAHCIVVEQKRIVTSWIGAAKSHWTIRSKWHRHSRPPRSAVSIKSWVTLSCPASKHCRRVKIRRRKIEIVKGPAFSEASHLWTTAVGRLLAAQSTTHSQSIVSTREASLAWQTRRDSKVLRWSAKRNVIARVSSRRACRGNDIIAIYLHELICILFWY